MFTGNASSRSVSAARWTGRHSCRRRPLLLLPSGGGSPAPSTYASQLRPGPESLGPEFAALPPAPSAITVRGFVSSTDYHIHRARPGGGASQTALSRRVQFWRTVPPAAPSLERCAAFASLPVGDVHGASLLEGGRHPPVDRVPAGHPRIWGVHLSVHV